MPATLADPAHLPEGPLVPSGASRVPCHARLRGRTSVGTAAELAQSRHAIRVASESPPLWELGDDSGLKLRGAVYTDSTEPRI